MVNKPINVPLRPVKLADQVLYYQLGTEVLQLWQRISILELGVATTGLVAERLRKDTQAWEALGLGTPKQVEEHPAQHARGVGDIDSYFYYRRSYQNMMFFIAKVGQHLVFFFGFEPAMK